LRIGSQKGTSFGEENNFPGMRLDFISVNLLISVQGGTLVNRDQFIKGGLVTTKIFLNAAGLLHIIQDRDPKPGKYRPDDENAPDPLDDTHIHPEDYELVRKMATDALELDEEDIHDEHPSRISSSQSLL
jgi:transcription elongation factor SPT6